MSPGEAHLGNSFVDFTRFKSIHDFLLKPCTFDRLTKCIKNSTRFKPRQEEEERLHRLSIQTKEVFKSIYQEFCI